MSSGLSVRLLPLAAFLWEGINAHSFFPSVNQPNTYQEGDLVPLEVNKVSSTRTLFPKDVYALPFCQPEGGPVAESRNLGQRLTGDLIQSAPYDIRMKEDAFCRQLCVRDLGRGQRHNDEDQNDMVIAIAGNYSHNWILDGMPAATKERVFGESTSGSHLGFPIGYIAPDARRIAYVHNHVNIEIQYRPVEGNPNLYHIVGFAVEPFSVRHRLDHSDRQEGNGERRPSLIVNPIVSCQEDWKTRRHTNKQMMREPQFASGDVLFTYDVIWKENKSTLWSERWDAYLSAGMNKSNRTHFWNNVVRAVILAVLAVAADRFIKGSTVRQSAPPSCIPESRALDRIRNQECDTSQTSDRQDVGPVSAQGALPTYALAVMCGTGAQLFFSVLITITLCLGGVCSSAKRGSIITGFVGVFVACGVFGGYFAARQYEMWNGTKEGRCENFVISFLVSLVLPSISVVVLVFSFSLAPADSTLTMYAIPIRDISFLISANVATVSVGSIIGFRSDLFSVAGADVTLLQSLSREFGNSRQQGKERASRRMTIASIVFLGILGNFLLSSWLIRSELGMILRTVWLGQPYACFGSLLVVVLLTAMSCAIASVLSIFFLGTKDKLMARNPSVRWYSFLVGGIGIGAALFHLSLEFWGHELDASGAFGVKVLYFAPVVFVSLCGFLAMGWIGVVSYNWYFCESLFSNTRTNVVSLSGEPSDAEMMLM